MAVCMVHRSTDLKCLDYIIDSFPVPLVRSPRKSQMFLSGRLSGVLITVSQIRYVVTDARPFNYSPGVAIPSHGWYIRHPLCLPAKRAYLHDVRCPRWCIEAPGGRAHSPDLYNAPRNQIPALLRNYYTLAYFSRVPCGAVQRKNSQMPLPSNVALADPTLYIPPEASPATSFPIHLSGAPPPSKLDPSNSPSHGALIPQVCSKFARTREHPRGSQPLETRHTRRQPRGLGIHPRRFLHQPRGILHQSRGFEAGFLRCAGRLLGGGGGAGCGCGRWRSGGRGV